MAPIPALRLSVSASGKVLVSRTPLEVCCDGNDDEKSFAILLGKGRIRVAESFGLSTAHACSRFTHFIPMFGRHGTLEGLTVGSDTSRKQGKTLLVIIEGVTKLPSVSQAGHHIPLCGMSVKCREGEIHGFVVILRRHEQLAFEFEHTCHRYVNRNGELVAGY